MEFDRTAALYNQISLPLLSIEVAMLVLIVVLPTAAICGYFAGALRRKALVDAGKPVDQVVGETTLGAILALLGLLLAFSFGNALTLSQMRKSAVVNESAAIGTAFLRADFLPEPGRLELQSALLEYAETRILPGDGSIDTLEAAQNFIALTLDAQAKLWPITLRATDGPGARTYQGFCRWRNKRYD